MTGKELIKWILDNDAVDKHIFIAKNSAGDGLRKSLKFKDIFDANISYSNTGYICISFPDKEFNV